MLTAARLLVLTVMLVALPALAETSNPLAPVDTSSPSAAFQSFVSEAEKIEKAYTAYRADKTAAKLAPILLAANRMRRLLDLSDVPPATRDKVGGAAFGYLVDILARLPEIPATEIPGAPGHDWGRLPAKWAIPGTEIKIARVEEGPRAGEYLFTGESVERLPEFHALIINQPPIQPVTYPSWRQEQVRLTGPFFSERLLRLIPEPLQRIILDTPAWKVLLTFLFAVAIFLLTFAWAMLARRTVHGVSRAQGLLWRLTTPLLLAALTYLADWFIRAQVNVSGAFAAGESVAAAILLYSAGAWTAWLVCFLVVEAIIATPSIPNDSYDAHLLRLAARVCALVAAGAVIVYGANDIGVPALGLIAGLGVGGFAVALAAQSTFENLFGGVSIFADRPFRVGDLIQYGEGSGTVEAIGPRSSRIRALDGTLITVPNGDLAKMHITNLSMRSKCLLLHTLGLRYETSPAQLEWLIEALSRLFGAHPMVEQSPGFPRIVVTGFGDSAITVEVRAYILTSSYAEFLTIQEQLILDIMRTVEGAGTGFAFPSRTAYLARDAGIDEGTKAWIEGEIRRRRGEPEAFSDAAESPGLDAVLARAG